MLQRTLQTVIGTVGSRPHESELNMDCQVFSRDLMPTGVEMGEKKKKSKQLHTSSQSIHKNQQRKTSNWLVTKWQVE